MKRWATASALAIAAAIAGPGFAQDMRSSDTAAASASEPILTEAGRPTRLDGVAEVRQIIDLGAGSNEFATYTETVIGADGIIDQRRLKGQFSYRFGQRFAEIGTVDNDQRHSLNARGRAIVVPNRVTVDAGALATFVNRDFRGAVSFSADDNNSNLAQTYTAFVAPHYEQPLGDVAEFAADYRVGYVNVDEATGGGGGGGAGGGLSPSAAFGNYSDSVNQTASLRVGNRASSSRVKASLIGEGTLENSDRLDQLYRSYAGRGEVEVAVDRTITLLASGGYESIRNTEDGILFDAAGLPVIGPDGDFVPDPGVRREVYDQNGVIYEGGVRLSPNRRLFVEARAGHRYGDLNINGQLSYRPTANIGISASWTEGLQSFGRLLTRTIDGVPTSFLIGNSLATSIGGCVFGLDPGTGQCLFDATQSITNATFKSEAGQVTVEAKRGRTRGLVALSRTTRRFVDAQQLLSPGETIDTTLVNRRDETLSINASVSRILDPQSSVSVTAFAYRFKFALAEGREVDYYGVSANYSLALAQQLSATFTGDLSKQISDSGRNRTTAIVSAGLSYRF